MQHLELTSISKNCLKTMSLAVPLTFKNGMILIVAKASIGFRAT